MDRNYQQQGYYPQQGGYQYYEQPYYSANVPMVQPTGTVYYGANYYPPYPQGQGHTNMYAQQYEPSPEQLRYDESGGARKKGGYQSQRYTPRRARGQGQDSNQDRPPGGRQNVPVAQKKVDSEPPKRLNYAKSDNQHGARQKQYYGKNRSSQNHFSQMDGDVSQASPESNEGAEPGGEAELQRPGKSYAKTTHENTQQPRRWRNQRNQQRAVKPGERWFEQGNYDQRDYQYKRQINTKSRSEDISGDSPDTTPEERRLQENTPPEERPRGKGQGSGRFGGRRDRRDEQGVRGHFRREYQPVGKQDDDETQRGSLIEQLGNNTYECMVCCEIVKREAAIWSCRNCHHVFHLRCISKWARSPTAALEGGSAGANGWRCPACQNVSERIPCQYRCFCGKVRDPVCNRFETPHSCGEVCGKQKGKGCTHPCNILCHPGPCPPCLANVVKRCDCGKTKKTIKCGRGEAIKCTETCGKLLNCGKHECQLVCHAGPCDPCKVQIPQSCFCDHTNRVVVCGTSESFTPVFSCGSICKRELDCKNHKCVQVCHPGSCPSCPLLPSNTKTCPCGKNTLEELPETGERKLCTDPIPTCKEICHKSLNCGTEAKPHFCQLECHEGPCGTCEGSTSVTCRCGNLTENMHCAAACSFTEADPFCCKRRCSKKLKCGRHKCAQLCCTFTEHNCELLCNQKLSCGLHRCEEPCHRGNCPTCWQVSFDELTCHCGAEVLYPPIPCGTRAPECKRFCTRDHDCGHPVRHQCHVEEICPPCTELTQKRCMGGHEVRKNIPCYLTTVSCGLLCSKPLPCGQHGCQNTCHSGECLAEGDVCKQTCTAKRTDCEHACGAPCHAGETCPVTTCKAPVTLKCKCGSRQAKAVCMMGGSVSSQEYQKLATSIMASKMAALQAGQTIDISVLTGGDTGKPKQRILECNEECAKLERNRRLALALEIKNPDLQGKLGTPAYSDFLKSYAKQHQVFVADIEKKFSTLVKNAQESKVPKRSHAFPPMTRDQRRCVHELAEMYGCETHSYDEEPKKNVVATAVKNKCWHPKSTLTSLIQRELHPKAPTPIPLNSREEDIRSAAEAEKKSTQVRTAWKRPQVSGSNQPSVPATWASKAAAAKKPPSMAEEVSKITTTKGASGGMVPLRKTLSKTSSLTTLGKTSTAKPAEPYIDYFEMTD